MNGLDGAMALRHVRFDAGHVASLKTMAQAEDSSLDALKDAASETDESYASDAARNLGAVAASMTRTDAATVEMRKQKDLGEKER